MCVAYLKQSVECNGVLTNSLASFFRAFGGVLTDPAARPQALPAVQLVVDRRWFQHPDTLPLLVTDSKVALDNSAFQQNKPPWSLSQTAAWHHVLHQKWR